MPIGHRSRSGLLGNEAARTRTTLLDVLREHLAITAVPRVHDPHRRAPREQLLGAGRRAPACALDTHPRVADRLDTLIATERDDTRQAAVA